MLQGYLHVVFDPDIALLFPSAAPVVNYHHIKKTRLEAGAIFMLPVLQVKYKTQMTAMAYKVSRIKNLFFRKIT